MRRGADRARERGATLVEMLAALFIVALASGLVVSTMAPPDDPREVEAAAFAAKLSRAADEAVISGLVIGAVVDEDGYRFYRRVAGEWTPVDDTVRFRDGAWSEGAIVSVSVEGDRIDEARLSDIPAEEIDPNLRFDPTGAATPAVIAIAYAEGDATVRVDAASAVTLEDRDG